MQKRATIKARFPSLIAHQSELSSAGIASTNQAAISAAIRSLLAKPQLKGKQIHSIEMSVSLINLDSDAINAAFKKAEGITDDDEEGLKVPEGTSVIREIESPNGKCKLCGQKVESLVRHLQECEKKPVLVK